MDIVADIRAALAAEDASDWHRLDADDWRSLAARAADEIDNMRRENHQMYLGYAMQRDDRDALAARLDAVRALCDDPARFSTSRVRAALDGTA